MTSGGLDLEINSLKGNNPREAFCESLTTTTPPSMVGVAVKILLREWVPGSSQLTSRGLDSDELP